MTMLEVKDLHAAYGTVTVLHGIDLSVAAGEIVAVVGANGAGKSTLMRSLAGLMTKSRRASSSGSVCFDGEDVSGVAASDRLRRGIALVPEGRQVWPEMTVRDNLLLGGFARRSDRELRSRQLDLVMGMFPRLGERIGQDAGTLSGGEQQMLAIGRALMSGPKCVLFDEPSMGLAPVIVDQILAAISDLRESGTTVLLVEQMVNLALEIADRAYVLERGSVVISGTPDELRSDERVRAAYLGAAVDSDPTER